MWSVYSAGLILLSAARQAFSPRLVFICLATGGLLAMPVDFREPLGLPSALAQDAEEAVPPDGQDGNAPEPAAQDEGAAQDDGADPADDSQFDNPDMEPLEPGEAVATRFSNVVDGVDGTGKPITVIDISGISASVVDLRYLGERPAGQQLIDEPQRMFVTAGEVGQVFGVTLGTRAGEAAEIFLSATAAYGLHRITGKDGQTNWMEGQWGPDGGAGTIYRVSAKTGFRAEKFADVTLDGRANTGAALGNIAYDRFHGRLFVSDLETGMIHSLDAQTGKDMGRFDHGMQGRADFLDAASGEQMRLDPVSFDPTTSARLDDCEADFSSTPACWNIADFRRRVWGLRVRADQSGAVRLYYTVWGSDAFGNPAWARAGDDRRNAVWSVAVAKDGGFDVVSVRREFFLPAFWPDQPSLGDKAGTSNPASDIAFPECLPQDVMLIAERGGMRNLGLDALEPFTRPYESRVLRYHLGADDVWRPEGRYDVGFHDRSIRDGEPLLFSSAAGGVDFNYRIGDNGRLGLAAPSQSVWMTGDGLCSPLGACTGKTAEGDMSHVNGLQGMPANAFVAVEPDGRQTADGLSRSYMIDLDNNLDEQGKPIAREVTRNDATRIGDVAVYQACGGSSTPVTPIPGGLEYEEEILPPISPPVEMPVHNLNMSHMKWASSGHRVDQSWHWRDGSWHQLNRSWHWREGSWHSANRSWHWRGGSWHSSDRSWHRRSGSWHDRDRSWHHKTRSWDTGHQRGRSFHDRGRSWGNDHSKNRSYHDKGRTWGNEHDKRRSYHVRGRSWGDERPTHQKGQSAHNKGRTFGSDRPSHDKRRSDARDNDKKPTHLRSRSRGDDARPVHSKRLSNSAGDQRPRHSTSRSRTNDAIQRPRRSTIEEQKPTHLRSRSGANDLEPGRLRNRNSINRDQQIRRQNQQNRNNSNDGLSPRRRIILEENR